MSTKKCIFFIKVITKSGKLLLRVHTKSGFFFEEKYCFFLLLIYNSIGDEFYEKKDL